MDGPPARNVTELLHAWSGGDLGAFEQLIPIVYADLKKRASRMLRKERRDTLQTTGLVHEAYLLLQRQNRVSWSDRSHFFAVSARLMRRILVDRARARRAGKRGGRWLQLAPEEAETPSAAPRVDLLDLDRALDELAALDDRQARMVELRYFGGLSLPQVAEAMGTSTATVKRDWTAARAWLYGRLQGSDPGPGRTGKR